MADIEYLKEIYFDPSHAGSFTGVEKFYQTVRNEGKFKISRKRIKQFLLNQEEYALQRDIKRKRKRRKVVVSGKDSQWGVDLANVESLQKSNDGIKYWLVLIDVLSKFVFVQTLTDKKASTIVDAFRKIINDAGRIPEVIFSDKGGEFNNFRFKNELKKHHIKYFTTQNEDIKNSVVERVIRTFRNKLYRFFQKQRTYRYVEKLPEITAGYNKTNHKSLPKNMAPVDVSKENEALVWDKMYNNDRSQKLKRKSSISKSKNKRLKTKQVFKFAIQDYVRLAFSR